MLTALPIALVTWVAVFFVARFLLRGSDFTGFDLCLEAEETATVVAITTGFFVYINPTNFIV